MKNCPERNFLSKLKKNCICKKKIYRCTKKVFKFFYTPKNFPPPLKEPYINSLILKSMSLDVMLKKNDEKQNHYCFFQHLNDTFFYTLIFYVLPATLTSSINIQKKTNFYKRIVKRKKIINIKVVPTTTKSKVKHRRSKPFFIQLL